MTLVPRHSLPMGKWIFVFFAIPFFGGTLSVRILNEARSPTSARVYLKDASGRALFPAATIVYDKSRGGILKQHFVPPDGTFEINLTPGEYSLEVEKGKEYVPVKERLQVESSGKLTRSIRLERWLRMAAIGWYSADMHIHRELGDLPALLEAEDLNVAVPITRWRRTGKQIDEVTGLRESLSRADSSGIVQLKNDRWIAVLNEELEPRASALLVSADALTASGSFRGNRRERAGNPGGSCAGTRQPAFVRRLIVAADSYQCLDCGALD